MPGATVLLVGPDRRQPFATIVEHDVPGFDEASQLDRPGVFRLNLDLGRAEFERPFGFLPKKFEEHRDEFDFARLDTVVPHPGYALYGFGSMSCPTRRCCPRSTGCSRLPTPEQSNATSAHPGGRPTSRARSPTARILAG
ncbi:DUF6194 family protein [Micromonospora sp. NPDC047730]|uniref:DUF6194 family protein n=1 Tax=Micromonospora sp. NPDC047730 TaxID=3364253 RepID=UPI0037238F44